jgi:hypothetical protein
MTIAGKTYALSNDRRKILEELGISMLTGEACSYSLRILCDLNEDGLKLINNIFGMGMIIRAAKHDETYRQEDHVEFMMRKHNSWVNSKPSIASIMLMHNMVDQVILFGLVDKHLSKGEVFVHATPKPELKSMTSPVMWGGTEDEYRAEWLGEGSDDFFRKKYWDWRLYKHWNTEQPRRGSFNVHAFTGRAP